MKKKNSYTRAERLTKRSEFVRLFDNPLVYKSGTFLAFYKESAEERSRLGITIKGKVTSVWRFRIKRTVREWFRLNKSTLGKVDLNIVLKPPANLMKGYVDRLKRDLQKWHAAN